MLNVDTSDRFAAGHVPGARWLSRSWLELRVAELRRDKAAPIVVTDEDGHDAVLAAATLARWVTGTWPRSPAAWRRGERRAARSSKGSPA